MAKLIDKLADCASGGPRCFGTFVRPPGIDPKGLLMCKPCKDDAWNALVLYVRGEKPISSLDNVRVTKGYMMNREIGVVKLFADHFANVDDDEIFRWWNKNVLGPERNPKYPSVRMFIDFIIRAYRDSRPKQRPAATTETLGNIIDLQVKGAEEQVEVTEGEAKKTEAPKVAENVSETPVEHDVENPASGKHGGKKRGKRAKKADVPAQQEVVPGSATVELERAEVPAVERGST